MQENPINNIVFDLGGVLVGLDSRRCVEAFQGIGCQDVGQYVADHRVEDLFLWQEIGQISTAEFCDEVRRICCCEATDEAIKWAWNELLTPVSQEKLDLLRRLKRHYRLFILSNTNEIHWLKSANDFFGCADSRCREFFDDVFLSYEIHMAKPHREIYQYVLEKGNMVAEETIFIDDSVKNGEAARSLGIGFWHEQSGQDWLERAKALL